MILAGISFTDPRLGTMFTDPDTFLGYFVSRLLVFGIFAAGFFFFIRLVLAGYNMMTSFGDSGKIDAARQDITHALIGLVIVVSTFFLAQLVQTILGIQIGL